MRPRTGEAFSIQIPADDKNTTKHAGGNQSPEKRGNGTSRKKKRHSDLTEKTQTPTFLRTGKKQTRKAS